MRPNLRNRFINRLVTRRYHRQRDYHYSWSHRTSTVRAKDLLVEEVSGDDGRRRPHHRWVSDNEDRHREARHRQHRYYRRRWRTRRTTDDRRSASPNRSQSSHFVDNYLSPNNTVITEWSTTASTTTTRRQTAEECESVSYESSSEWYESNGASDVFAGDANTSDTITSRGSGEGFDGIDGESSDTDVGGNGFPINGSTNRVDCGDNCLTYSPMSSESDTKSYDYYFPTLLMANRSQNNRHFFDSESASSGSPLFHPNSAHYPWMVGVYGSDVGTHGSDVKSHVSDESDTDSEGTLRTPFVDNHPYMDPISNQLIPLECPEVYYSPTTTDTSDDNGFLNHCFNDNNTSSRHPLDDIHVQRNGGIQGFLPSIRLPQRDVLESTPMASSDESIGSPDGNQSEDEFMDNYQRVFDNAIKSYEIEGQELTARLRPLTGDHMMEVRHRFQRLIVAKRSPLNREWITSAIHRRLRHCGRNSHSN